MFLFANGLFISPMPFLWGQILPFARAEDGQRGWPWRRAGTAGEKLAPPESASDTRECAAVSAYQMGCLAQQMSCSGCEALPGVRCPCESSDAHCLARMR